MLAGAALLLFALYDVFATVLIIGDGAGPQSRVVADRSWRLAIALHDPDSEGSHSRMRSVGPLIVLLVLTVWVLEFTLAWALVFVPEAFSNGGRAHFDDRLVFAAQTVLGRGGNSPALEVADGGWELLHSLAGLTGVVLVSVGLAYVLPILSSVAQKRSVAASINGIGSSVDEMRELAAAAGGELPAADALGPHLVTMANQVTLVAERHRAYPVLHYFHSRDYHAAFAPALVKLALLVRDAPEADVRVHPGVSRLVEQSAMDVLEAVARMGLSRYARGRDDIDDDDLVELVIDPSRASAKDMPSPPLAWMRAYVQFDGWGWEEIERGDATLRQTASR